MYVCIYSCSRPVASLLTINTPLAPEPMFLLSSFRSDSYADYECAGGPPLRDQRKENSVTQRGEGGVRGGDKQSWVGRGGGGGGQRGRGRGEEGSGSDVRATINQVPD